MRVLTLRRGERATDRYRGPERRSGRGVAPALQGARVFTDLMVLGFATSAALVVGPAADVLLVPATDAQRLVAVVAAVLAAAAGILALVRSRLGGDARMTYIGIALVLYGTIVVPSASSATSSLVSEFADGLNPLRIAGVVGVLVLLLLGLLAPDVDSRQSLWRPALLTALGVGVLAFIPGDLARRVPEGLVDEGVLVAWCLMSISYLILAVRRGRQAFWRVGAGLALIAVAYALRITTADGVTYSLASIAAVRLVGLAALMAGVAPDVRAAFESRRRREADIRDQWVNAEQQVRETTESVAERDHEIRNVLAGLTGASYLLGRRSDSLDNDQVEQLGRAVHSELERLKLLVSDDKPERRGAYDVREVLAPLVTAEQQQGREVHLDAAPGLQAYGRSTVLAQIVVNLLTNCARHAPGAFVLISAIEQSDRVLVTVADDGPGVRAGEEDRVLERGARGQDTQAPGSGLGLHVSSRLAVGEGGALRMLPTHATGRGCTVVLELPRAELESVSAAQGADQAVVP